ncbi:MAG: hypothetical protein LBQ89_02220 [Treponema sp.]|jgi:hypothetical protein|nr:hypothetical protein [Treponema sp.]
MIQKIKDELSGFDKALAEYKKSSAMLKTRFPPGTQISEKVDLPIYEAEMDTIYQRVNKKCGAAYDTLNEIIAEIYREQPRLVNLQVHETPASGFPHWLSFGRLRLTNEVFPKGRDFIPRILDFPPEKGIYLPSIKSSLKNHVWPLLFRLLTVIPTGKLEIYAADPVQSGKSLEPFLPLVSYKSLFPSGILRNGRDIETMLEGLDVYINGLIQNTFATGKFTNWKDYNAAVTDAALPYKVLILVSMPEQLTDSAITSLKRILRHGPSHGVLPVLLLNEKELSGANVSTRHKDLVENIERYASGINSLFPVKLSEIKVNEEEDNPPDEKLMRDLVEAVRNKIEAGENKPKTVDMLFVQQRFWQGSGIEEISAPVGWTKEGNAVNFCLGDDPAHGLLGGITRSGKSNLLHVMIQSLCFQYSPDELQLYLMDFKDGLEFKLYTEPVLPHARLISCVGDPEFGADTLTKLVEEMKDRFEKFKNANAANYIQYRKTGEQLPRLLVIIDEFQELLKDKRSETMLGDLLRRCGAAGIHILLATQTLHGLNTTALSQLTALLGCRIALYCNDAESRQILGNEAAVNITPRKDAILNSRGNTSGNVFFTHPKAEPEVSRNVLDQLAARAKKEGFVQNAKIVLDNENPKLPPHLNIVSPGGLCFELGTKIEYSGEILRIVLEQKAGANVLISGAGDRLHDGLMGAVIKSALSQVEEIIFCGTLDSVYAQEKRIIESNPAEVNWDELKSGGKKKLVIIDELEAQKALRKQRLNAFGPAGAGQGQKSPGDAFAGFLEEGAAAGIHLVAFCRNWILLNNSNYRDMFPSFACRIAYNLDPIKAGEATDVDTKILKGLDDEKRAFYKNALQNEAVSFLPYIPDRP